MKRLLVLALFASAILMYSCNKLDSPVDSSNDNMSMIVNQVVPDGILSSLDQPYMVDGTLESDIEFTPEFSGPTDNRGPNDRKPDDRGRKIGIGMKFREIFYHLKLTADQRTEIARILIAHHKCVEEVMMASQAQRRDIIQKANAQIKEILRQLKAGEAPYNDPDPKVNRKAAGDAIKLINEATRTALQALVNTQALCECWKTMIAAIQAVLTPSQLEMFNKWMANMPNPCKPLTDRDPNTRP